MRQHLDWGHFLKDYRCLRKRSLKLNTNNDKYSEGPGSRSDAPGRKIFPFLIFISISFVPILLSQRLKWNLVE